MPKVGYKPTPEHRAAVSIARRGTMTGSANPRWQGENVEYSALHHWVRYNKVKTGICTVCKKARRTEWANIDHKYRRVLADFVEMCTSCHRIHDLSMEGGTT